MAYLEELLPEFRKGAKIRCSDWEKDKYIQKKGGLVATDNDFLCSLSVSDIFSNRWELYQEPIDWDYIIKNKCLCWFWDGCQNSGRFGILVNVNCDDENLCSSYKESWGNVWENCRPVRRDEVTFYEDRKDDQD